MQTAINDNFDTETYIMLEVWGRKNANQVIQVLWTLSELESSTKDTPLE